MSYGSPEPVRIKRIADSHEIPHGFLVQILQQLKGAGYVTSTRGSSGGYQLTRSPDQISLAEVVNAIDGPRHVDYDLSSSSVTPALRALRSVWQQATDQVHQTLMNVTFADLVECTRQDSSMPIVGDFI